MNPLLQKLLVVATFLFIAIDAFADPTPTPIPKPLAEGIVQLLVNNTDLTGNPALDLSYVDGFRPRSSWAIVQPDTTGNPAIDSVNYDWSALDDVIAQAAAHGKFVGISVGAGAYVPNWVYVGSPTVYKYFIDVSDDSQAENATEPFPWDVNYLNKWKTFIAAFGAKYDGNPHGSLCRDDRDAAVCSTLLHHKC